MLRFIFFYIFQTPTPSITDSEKGKPIAEVKPEPRPVSKSRTLHPLNRQERTQPKQPPQPIVLSQVSMQDSKKIDEKSEDSSVKNLETDSIAKKPAKTVDSSGPSGIKMERTKTNLNMKKTKYSGGKDTQGSDKKSIDQRPTLHREHTSSIPNKSMVKSVEDSLKHELMIGSSDSHRVTDNQNSSKSLRIHNDREKSRNHHRDIKLPKDKALPKPAPPSQQYLEGSHTAGSRHGEPMWSQKLPPSPLSSKDGAFYSDSSDLDWLNTVKR